jgi:S1-C subfamily serine protease
MKRILLALTVCIGFAAQGVFAQAKGLDSKMIANTYYKGVVKILLVDSALEKEKPGSGYIGRGSGFFVTDDGVIFTNRHVVQYCVNGYIDYDYKDASGSTVSGYEPYSQEIINDPSFVKAYRTGYTTPIVQVYWGQGQNDYTQYVAKVLTIGTGSFDGAMIKIVSDLNGAPVYKKFSPVPIGNSDIAVQGEDLCVYGYPAQYDGGYETMLKDMSTLTFGKLSGYDYVFNKDYGYIKTDASINGGNSGGPVFDESNKVIGIATAVGNKTGIGLVGGINGMYYVAAPQSDVLQKLIAKGLTIPKNAGSISTSTGERKPILSADQINASHGGGGSDYTNTNTYNTNNSNNNTSGSGGSGIYASAKVYCTDQETGGDPVTAFTITSAGGYVWVYADNYPGKLETEELIVDVWKKGSGDSYTEFVETKYFDVKSTLTTTYFKYTFYKEGDYKIMVYNKDSKLIGSAFATISIKGSDSNNSGGGSGDYGSSRVYFTNDVSDDGTIGEEGTTYNINKSTGSYVYCIVTNYPTPLNTDELIVDIYKKSGGSTEYKFVETKYYTISTTTKTTYFKYTFYEKGEYKFSVYNKNSKWINTGYVTINYQ